VAWRQHDLQQAAAAWVTLADLQRPALKIALKGRYVGTPDDAGVCVTQQLRTANCASHTFFPTAHREVLVLWEPFGGLCV
jgi:hypothetical protein